jgi:hypothetical protein
MTQQIVRFLVASLLFTLTMLPSALAQTGNTQTANDTLPAEKISVEAGPATPCQDVAHSEPDPAPGESAQRRPATPLPPRLGYPRSVGPRGAAWQPGNKRHALIGAIIGFGIGAAVGAKGHRDLGSRALIAGVGAALGAAVGNATP